MKILINRRSSAPKADNTIGMYKRDGRGAYTTSEEDEVPVTSGEAAHNTAARLKAAAAKAAAERKARQMQQQQQQQKQQQQQPSQQNNSFDQHIDEITVQDIKDRVADRKTRIARKKKNRAAHQSYLDYKQAKFDAKGGDTADSIRRALGSQARRRVLGNSFDPTLDEIRNPLRNDPPAVAATKELGAKRVRLAKRADAADAHTAMVNRLHAARGTKPNKPLGIWKDKIKSEGTNASQRGEIQSPGSKKEYDALSPENKKIIDRRVAKARAQGMLPNPNSSPPRPSNPQRRNKANQRRARAIRQQTSEYTPDHGESLGEVVSKAVKTDRRAKATKELKKRHPDDPEARAGAGGRNRASGKMARVAYSNWRNEIEEDRRGETFEVKYAMSKKGPIRVSKFNSHSDAHKFLAQVRKQGFKGMVVSPNFSKGVDRKTESVDFDEGEARDREERVYGSGASKDMNWGVEPEDANTRRARARYRAQERERNRRAEQGGPKPKKKKLGETNLAKPKAPGIKIKPGKSSRRLKPPPAPPKGYEEKHPLSQKDRAAIRNKLGQEKYPQTEEVSWEEAQYWSEDTVADFLKRGGKITKLNPRVARGATKKQTIRLRGSTKSTADRGRKAEKKVHGEEVEEIDEISRETKDRYLKAASKDLIKQKERSNTIWWKKDNFRGGKTPIARSQDSVAAAKRKVKNRVRGIRRAADTVTIRKEDVIDEGGMGNNPPKKRPMSDAQKERRAKHQKLLKIIGAKRSKAPRKKARGKTKISKIAGRYEEKEKHWTEREREDMETDRRLAGVTPKDEREAQKKARAASAQQRKQEREKKKASEEYADLGEISDGLAKRVRSIRRKQERKAWDSLYKSHNIEPRTPEVKAAEKPPRIIITKSHKLRDLMNRRGSEKSRRRRRAKAAMTQQQQNAEYTPDHGEAIDEAKMGAILKRVIRGASPFTIVALKNGRAIDQEHAKISQAVPAFVREMKKKHPNARISVEDRTGRVLHTEEYIDEAVSVDGRTRDYRGTRTRLEAKGRRRGEGLDGRTKGYRDAYARTMARQQRAAADAAMMEPEEAASTEIEEMMIDELTPAQKAAKDAYVQSKGGRKHGGLAGKRNSRQIRRKSTSPGSHERGPGTPPRDIDIWALGKKNADWGLGRILAKKKRGSKIEREIEEMQSGSKQSPVDASTASSNLKYKSGSKHATGTSKRPEKKQASKAARQIGKIGKEDLKDLMHKKDLDNRHRRKAERAAERTAKTRRSFGPKGKKPEGAMKIAFRKALELKKKQQKK